VAIADFWMGLAEFQRQAIEHRRFAGDADVPQAIGPVAGHFQVDGKVVAQRLGRFVIEAGHHQPVGRFRGSDGERDMLLEPVPRN
jgi:hypothetical protein